MKVLFVSPAAELGGAERCLLDALAVMHEHGGVETHVIAFADGPLLARARELGTETQILPAPEHLAQFGESGSVSGRALLGLIGVAPRLAHFLGKLRAAIVRAKPDVVHTNGMKAHLLAGLVAPRNVRLVVHLHDFTGTRRASKWFLPALGRIRRRAVFVAISRAVARDFSRIAPGADVRTVYNVVDTQYFHEGAPARDWLASLTGLSPSAAEGTSFGLVATYARWKGHGLFIEAAGLLKKARPDLPLHFYVIGGPIYETAGSQVDAAELLECARRAGIEAQFGLVPFQSDIARVYRALDVVVHASTQPEPFGRTIVEAMACARPVIVARAGGAAELFDDGANALGFEPNDAAKLANVMLRALDPDLRARLGSSARKHAVVGFGRSRLAGELLQIYASHSSHR